MKQSQEVTMLKGQLEGIKTKKEELTNKLQEKDSEIKILHKRLNKESIISLKFQKSSSDLNDLLGKQGDPSDKRGIGFECSQENEEIGENSKAQKGRVEDNLKKQTYLWN